MKISLQDIRDIDKYFSNKQYDRAIELLKKLIEKNEKEYSLRMKLADAYYLYGKNKEAVSILADITEEYARAGFVTKAMALQKRIQRIDPQFELDIYSFIEESDESSAPLVVSGSQATENQHAGDEDSRFKVLDGLFSGLPRDEFNTISSLLDEVTVDEGKDVFVQGDADNNLYIIISGTVLVHTYHKDKRIELARLRSGAFFGEVALLTGKARTATVTCEEESTFLVLDRERYLQISKKYPGMKTNLAKTLESRAQKTVEKIIETEMES
jgi:CRP-like cAMP-binding protein